VWSLAVLPDNRTLVSGSKDGTVFVWDMGGPRRVSPHIRLPENLMTWSFATNDQTVVLTCDRRGRVVQWREDFLAGDPIFEIGTNFTQAAFVPHRSILLARLPEGNVQIWDLRTRTFVRELSVPISRPPKCFFVASGNRLIIVSVSGDALHEFDLDTGRKVRTWKGPSQLWNSALSPDGQWLVTLGRTGASMIDDLNTGLTKTGKIDTKGALGVTFSLDGKLLAVASDQGFARIWDAATLQPVVDLRGFLQGVYSVAFSPDGQRLVTGSDGKEAIKLWDVESHEELLTLEGQGSMFNHTAFSLDGEVLGSMNSTDTKRSVLHLWRAPSWAEIEAKEKSSLLSRP
jgi:WD40 repeat protein